MVKKVTVGKKYPLDYKGFKLKVKNLYYIPEREFEFESFN